MLLMFASKMKNAFHILAGLLIIPALVWAEPESKTDFSKISEPPMNAPTGQKHEGVQIGLWTEKLVYDGDEIRNVWMLARSDRSSDIIIGVGGSLFKNSFLYITSDDKNVLKLPLDGGIDGIVNPSSIAGGLSGKMAKLPSGRYQLTWKTELLISNTITIEIKKAEQAESLKP